VGSSGLTSNADAVTLRPSIADFAQRYVQQDCEERDSQPPGKSSSFGPAHFRIKDPQHILRVRLFKVIARPEVHGIEVAVYVQHPSNDQYRHVGVELKRPLQHLPAFERRSTLTNYHARDVLGLEGFDSFRDGAAHQNSVPQTAKCRTLGFKISMLFKDQ